MLSFKNVILTNKTSKFSGHQQRPPTGLCPVPANRPPADFPTLALRARGVPKLTSGYATVKAEHQYLT